MRKEETCGLASIETVRFSSAGEQITSGLATEGFAATDVCRKQASFWKKVCISPVYISSRLGSRSRAFSGRKQAGFSEEYVVPTGAGA